MTKAHEIFLGLAARMKLERSQGLDFEARHILPPDWSLEYRADGYVFTGPFSDAWEDVVWQLVRFLSYKSVIALSRSGARDHLECELITCMDDGTGFRAVFRSQPS
jgi:hypothetical protein